MKLNQIRSVGIKKNSPCFIIIKISRGTDLRGYGTQKWLLLLTSNYLYLDIDFSEVFIYSEFNLASDGWYYHSVFHYSGVMMVAMASQITSITIVYSTVYSGADQRKHQSSASLAFVRGIHRSPVNSPHKWPVTWKMLPFDDVMMSRQRSAPDLTQNNGDKPLPEPILTKYHSAMYGGARPQCLEISLRYSKYIFVLLY